MGEQDQCQTMDLLFDVPDLDSGGEEISGEAGQMQQSSRPNSPGGQNSRVDSPPSPKNTAFNIPLNDVRSELFEKGSQLSHVWSDLVSTLMKYQAGLVSMEVKLASNSGHKKTFEMMDCSCGGEGTCANSEHIQQIRDELSVKDRLLLKCQQDLLAAEERLSNTEKDLSRTKEVLKNAHSELKSKGERLNKLELELKKLNEKVQNLQSEANTKDLLVAKLQNEMVRDNGELTMEINKLRMSYENDKQHMKIEIKGLKRNLEMERKAHDETRRLYQKVARNSSAETQGNQQSPFIVNDENEADGQDSSSGEPGCRSRSSSETELSTAQDLSTHCRDPVPENRQQRSPHEIVERPTEYKVMSEYSMVPLSTSIPMQGYESPNDFGSMSLPHASGRLSQADDTFTQFDSSTASQVDNKDLKLQPFTQGTPSKPLPDLYISQSGRYKCSDCGNCYRYASGLSRHKLVHKQIQISCSHCQRVFLNYNALFCHRKICMNRQQSMAGFPRTTNADQPPSTTVTLPNNDTITPSINQQPDHSLPGLGDDTLTPSCR